MNAVDVESGDLIKARPSQYAFAIPCVNPEFVQAACLGVGLLVNCVWLGQAVLFH